MTKVNLKFLATLCLYCELATRLVITNQRAYLIEYNLRSHFFPRKGKKLQSKQFSYCKCYILAHTILDNFRLYSFVVILSLNAQCSRTDLIKRSLPRPKTTVPQHESLYPIELKSARTELLHIGFHYINFSKTAETALQ